MPPDPPTPADRGAKIAELKRELSFRGRVYRKWVREHRITRDQANRQYFVLQCILEDYTGNTRNTNQAVTRWTCPLCDRINFSPAGVQLVDCEDGCRNGPFYLAAEPGDRKLLTTPHYRAHRIDGLPYHTQPQLDLETDHGEK